MTVNDFDKNRQDSNDSNTLQLQLLSSFTIQATNCKISNFIQTLKKSNSVP